MKGCLTLLGNVIWLLAGGIICGLTWFLTGLLLCITIIGIPFGKQCFKFASLSFAPFGKTVVSNFGAHPVMNVIWIIFFGWEMFLSALFSGALLCITVVGIPFGLQAFKLAVTFLMPFGATIR